MGKIGVIREQGIDEIVVNGDEPRLIFGLNDVPSQKKERRSIGHALVKTGLEVYAATDTNWPNDSYVSHNGLYIPERDFGELAHGGNYIFGDGFVLVSDVIREGLERKLRDSEHFRDFFSESEVIFIPPYLGKIETIQGAKIKPKHIDITVGYVPDVRLLSVDDEHYYHEATFDELRRNFGVVVNITTNNLFPNNFYVVQHDGRVSVIANRCNNPFRHNDTDGFETIETGEDIVNLPGKSFGSVKCAVNMSPTTELWDALGIEYRRWGVNPNQVN